MQEAENKAKQSNRSPKERCCFGGLRSARGQRVNTTPWNENVDPFFKVYINQRQHPQRWACFLRKKKLYSVDSNSIVQHRKKPLHRKPDVQSRHEKYRWNFLSKYSIFLFHKTAYLIENLDEDMIVTRIVLLGNVFTFINIVRTSLFPNFLQQTLFYIYKRKLRFEKAFKSFELSPLAPC